MERSRGEVPLLIALVDTTSNPHSCHSSKESNEIPPLASKTTNSLRFISSNSSTAFAEASGAKIVEHDD